MLPRDEAVLASSAATLERAEAAPRATRLLSQLVPPVVCFLLSRGMLHAAAVSTENNPLDPNTWLRWDSAQYLSIASVGYYVSRCVGLEGYDPSDWCGNDAWLPGYALLIKLLTQISPLTYVEAGVAISATFACASLITIWLVFLRAQFTASNILVLLLAAFFPGHIYDHAIFPISQFVFLVMLSLWFHSGRRFAISGLCAAAAAFSYSSGLFLCGAFVLPALVRARDKLWKTGLRNLFFPCGGVLLGFSAALALQFMQTGVWNAFFLVQRKYAYAPRTPFEAWKSNIMHWVAHWPRVGALDGQTLFVAALCLLMLGFVVKRRAASRLDGLLIAFGLLYWLIPIVLGGQLALYRAEATLLPALPLARRIPWPILGVLLCIAIRLSWVMGRAFFMGKIV